MFKRYSGGEFAPGGVYWSNKAWELVTISEDGGHLPGSEDVTYFQVPVLLMLGLGPLIGLVFILLVPLLVPFVALYEFEKVIARNTVRAALEAGKGRG